VYVLNGKYFAIQLILLACVCVFLDPIHGI